MRKWGIAITLFYALVVVYLLVPGTILLFDFAQDISDALTEPLALIWIAILVGGEAMLLFLSVDTSHKRLRPRQHVLASIVTVALLCALLAFAAIWSLVAAVYGDGIPRGLSLAIDSRAAVLGSLVALWVIWGLIFHAYFRGRTPVVTKLISWLLKGSVLELLIAVPCHVIVRHRDDCSAPGLTAFGIASGVAIMLLCFGPSVLFLYRKRLDSYARQTPDRDDTTGPRTD